MGYSIGYKTKDELVAEITDDIIALTPLNNVSSASTLSGIVTAVSQRLADAYDSIEANFTAQYTRTATGMYLDLKAEDIGLTRRTNFVTEIPCTAKLISIRTKDGTPIWSKLGDQTGNYKVIGRGMEVSSSAYSDLSMTTIESAFLLPDTTVLFLGVSGEFSDREIISAGTFDQFNFDESVVFDGADLNELEVVQSSNIVGVEQIETDEELRSRIRNWTTVAAMANSRSIADALFSSSEVADVIPQPGIRGTGSANFVAIPRSRRISQVSMNKIQQEVDNRKSYGEDIRVVQPVYIPVHMKIRISNPSLINSAINAIENGFESIRGSFTLNFQVIKEMCASAGIVAETLELNVDGQNILKSGSVSSLDTELFELDIPVSLSSTFSSPIEVVVS